MYSKKLKRTKTTSDKTGQSIKRNACNAPDLRRSQGTDTASTRIGACVGLGFLPHLFSSSFISCFYETQQMLCSCYLGITRVFANGEKESDGLACPSGCDLWDS